MRRALVGTAKPGQARHGNIRRCLARNLLPTRCFGSLSASPLRRDITHGLGEQAPLTIGVQSDSNISSRHPKTEPAEPWRILPPFATFLSLDSHLELAYQSDVGGLECPGKSRAVDADEGRNDLNLWLTLLEFQRRKRGVQGVLQIWDQMRQRNVDLETEETWRARSCWLVFLDALPTKHLLDYAYDLYCRTGNTWPQLFTFVIRNAIYDEEVNEDGLLERLNLLERLGFPRYFQFQLLIPAAVSSERALAKFSVVYELQERSDGIYSNLMHALLEKESTLPGQARRWHYRLVEAEDFRMDQSTIRAVGRLFSASKRKSVLQQMARKSHSLKTSQSLSRYWEPALSTERRQRLLEGGAVSDEWAARAFATRSMPLDYIVNGLIHFQFRTLGPLAMRELAMRCETLDELRLAIEDMEDRGIVSSTRPFCSLLRKAIVDRDQMMAAAILNSDIHPEVYEDIETQQQLLLQYRALGDMPQLRRTVAALHIFHRQSLSTLWNGLFKDAATDRQWGLLEQITYEMVHNFVPINESSVARSFHALIDFRSTRHQGAQQSNPQRVGDVVFVANMWLNFMKSNSEISPLAWRRIFTYFGMEGRLDCLEELAVRLAANYSSKMGHAKHNPPNSDRIKSLQRLYGKVFDRRFCSNVITWSFQSLAWPGKKRAPFTLQWDRVFHHTDEWTRGLLLLRFLRSHYFVGMYDRNVRKDVLIRLEQLFGTKVSDRHENIRARHYNTLPLNSVIEAINRAWGKELFNLPDAMHDEKEMIEWLRLQVPGRAGLPAGNPLVSMAFPGESLAPRNTQTASKARTLQPHIRNVQPPDAWPGKRRRQSGIAIRDTSRKARVHSTHTKSGSHVLSPLISPA